MQRPKTKHSGGHFKKQKRFFSFKKKKKIFAIIELIWNIFQAKVKKKIEIRQLTAKNKKTDHLSTTSQLSIKFCKCVILSTTYCHYQTDTLQIQKVIIKKYVGIENGKKKGSDSVEYEFSQW